MRFSILQWRSAPPAGVRTQAYLVTDSWDDFSFKTSFYLTYVDDHGNRTEVGAVKVAAFEMGSGPGRTELPQTFDRLSERFFSLGQTDDYYENLNALGTTVRDEILTSLRDVAF